MSSNLFDQFLAEECSPYVRGLLKAAIANEATGQPHFEFNRFEVTIKRDTGSVLIEDVLDASELGSEHISISEFVVGLNRSNA